MSLRLLLKNLIFLPLLFLVLAIAPSCGESDWSDELSDAELAKIRCGNCHLMPAPSLLPKDRWENLLPNMGARLGMTTPGYDPLADKNMQRRFKLEAANIYPKTPLLSEKEWKRVKEYFLNQAPEKLGLAKEEKWPNSTLFQESYPSLSLASPPAVTMVKYDPTAKSFYVADRSGNTGKLKSDFSFEYRVQLPKPIVDVSHGKGDLLTLLSIGELYPDESNQGAVVELYEKNAIRQGILQTQLPRPVQFTAADLDKNGQEDFLVCSYGNDIGKFSWFRRAGGRLVETVLKPVPGATRTFVEDLDSNGFDDVIALFAQGDEGVSIFYNKNGEFREERPLRFHPVHGTSDMEFLDFDGDGDKDIVLSNGDNGDYSNVLKPYHGVHVYLNDGNQKFEEKFFFPMYGAAKVRCRDFDMDGDMDLFVMSFFPDFKNGAKQSLLYLENKGNWEFSPNAIEGAGNGRWMVMDAGDMDGDGDEDIMLGSFTLNSTGVDPELMQSWISENRSILYLENRSR